MKLSIIIPCFNEAGTITEVIRRVEDAGLPPGWNREIVIVDDCSTDGTRDILAGITGRHTVVLRDANGGKGAAVKSGLQKVTGDYVVIQDADLEYDPNDFSALITQLDRAPIVFGSRVRKVNERYSSLYFWGGKGLSYIFNFLFRTSLSDITCCYKLFPSTLNGALIAWPHDDFVFDAVCMTHTLAQNGPVAEVPVSYAPRSREEGKKVRMRHGVQSVLLMLELRAGRFAQFGKYFVVGGLAFVTNIAALYLLTEFAHLYYIVSAVIAFCAAFIINFLLQRFWTFSMQTRTHLKRHALQFLMLQVASNMVLNAALLYALVEYLHLWYIFAQTFISLGLAVLTYVVSKRYIFTAQS